MVFQRQRKMAELMRRQQASTTPALRPKKNHDVDKNQETAACGDETELRISLSDPGWLFEVLSEALTCAPLCFAVVRQGR